MFGVKTDELGSEPTDEKLEIYEKGCSPSLQNIEGIMIFLLDENFNWILKNSIWEWTLQFHLVLLSTNWSQTLLSTLFLQEEEGKSV